MINIRFNNQWIYLKTTCSLKELLIQQQYIGDYFSIALNHHFIPRSQYATTVIKESDLIEVITPMQGG